MALFECCPTPAGYLLTHRQVDPERCSILVRGHGPASETAASALLALLNGPGGLVNAPEDGLAGVREAVEREARS